MHVKDLCTKPCAVGTIGLILAGFGALFAIFWRDIFDLQVANVSKRTSRTLSNNTIVAVVVSVLSPSNPSTYRNK